MKRKRPSADNAIVLQLPAVLITHILEWVPFSDRLTYFSCNQNLWRSCRRAYESLLQNLVVPKPPSPILLNNNFTNLVSLNVGSRATDDFLRALESPQAIPRLKHLSMIHSLRVTDAGLESIPRNSIRCKTLESIDITYCRNTTYGGTFCLRDELTALKLLRRQPKWMDGTYSCVRPNGRDITTYWADGTFFFLLRTSCSGYVCDLFQWTSDNERRVGVMTQFNNSYDGALELLPQIYRSVFRPGFSILRLPNEGALLSCILLKGIYPPKDHPTKEHVNLVPLGESRNFDLEGNVLPVSDLNTAMHHFQINHATKASLQSLMPPPEIVELNRLQVSQMQPHLTRSGVWNRLETRLHTLTGGGVGEVDAIALHYESSRVNHLRTT